MTEARSELYDVTWTETSFVPAGDNPEARLVFWKSEPGEAELTDQEIEEVLASVEKSEASEAEGEGRMALTDEQREALDEIGRDHAIEHFGIEVPAAEAGGAPDPDDEGLDEVGKMLKAQGIEEGSPFAKYLRDVEARAEGDRKTVEKMVEDQAEERLLKQARAAGAEDPKEFAKLLRRMEKGEATEADASIVTAQIKAANSRAAGNVAHLSSVVQAAGGGASGSEADAFAEVNKLASAKIEAQPERFGKIDDPNARLAAARTEVYADRPDLKEAASQ